MNMFAEMIAEDARQAITMSSFMIEFEEWADGWREVDTEWLQEIWNEVMDEIC